MKIFELINPSVRIANALERIASALERAFPPLLPDVHGSELPDPRLLRPQTWDEVFKEARGREFKEQLGVE